MEESIPVSLASVRDVADTENTSTDVTNNNKMFRVPSDVDLSDTMGPEVTTHFQT